MSEDKEELIEEIREQEIKNRRKIEVLIGVPLLLMAAVAGGVFLQSEIDFNLLEEEEELPQEYASAGTDTVHRTSQLEASEIFNLTDKGVSPASHRVELGEAIGFRNQINQALTITFDRSEEDIELPSGESETLYINGITYFEVEGPDYSARGRVNVQ